MIIKYSATAKRKTCTAIAYVSQGCGHIKINEKPFEIFFGALSENFEKKLKFSLNYLNLRSNYDIIVHVKGGGLTSQFDAAFLAICKSLCIINNQFVNIFKKHKLLIQDSRIKERKKYGLKKARKAPQYSKR